MLHEVKSDEHVSLDMKYLFILIFALSMFSCDMVGSRNLQQGDIVFQISKSSQSQAIQLATGSKYSHCGIVFLKGEEVYVYEAVQPVKLTKWADWIKRGESGHYVVKRLRESRSTLTPQNLSKLYQEGLKFNGKDYDSSFQWSDDKIYCSELIWKTYYNALGIELSALETFGDFDFSHPEVQKKLRERFKGGIPKDAVIVSPKALFQSEQLETVYTKN